LAGGDSGTTENTTFPSHQWTDYRLRSQMTWRHNVTVTAECRQRVRFEERDGEGLATLDCTSDEASRQSIQVVGICALATHEDTSNAGLMRLGVGHCFRHDCIVLLQTIGDTRHSCHQYSVTQPCIAGFVDRNLFMFTGGHVLQSRRPPPPVSSVTRWKRRWSWCESVANSHVLRTPLANSNRFVAHGTRDAVLHEGCINISPIW
jgi:hypothetical protein